jgi:quercetin dioxygenase-like cupin family protein
MAPRRAAGQSARMAAIAIQTELVPFLAGTAEIRVSRFDGGNDLSVIEIEMPAGSMPPVHVHDEDETVCVVEGRMTFYVGGDLLDVRAGDSFVAPKGVPHTYRVESDGGARWLSVTKTGRFEAFVRAVGHLPAGLSVRTAIAFTAAAAENGIEIVGPPGALPTSSLSSYVSS